MDTDRQPDPLSMFEDSTDAPPVRPLLVSQVEAARLLGVERTTIWRMLKRGELDSVSIGTRRLVTLASLEDFVACAARSDPMGRRGSS